MYMVVAMAQSFAWLFVLPMLCKPLWEQVFHDGRSPNDKEVILNLSGIFATFAIYMSLLCPIYYLEIPFFEQFKINKDHPWPWKKQNTTNGSDQEHEAARKSFWALTRKSVQLLVFNQFLLVPILTFTKHAIVSDSAPCFDVEEWPSYWEMIRDNCAMCVCQEFGLYVTHRLMHSHKFFYQFHKVHHEYKQNSVMAAFHSHPVDYLISIITPALLCPTLVVKPHSFTQFQFAVYMMVTFMDDHSGYAFPWSPVRWFPFASLTEQHEFHHSINMGCFASKLNIYDKMFDSDGTYLKWTKKRAAESHHAAKEE